MLSLSFAFCLLPVLLQDSGKQSYTRIWSAFALPKVGAVEVNRQLNIPLNNGTQGEARDEADVLLRLGGQEEQKGNLNKALGYWLQALKVYQEVGDDTAIGLTYDYIGLTYASMGRYREAEDTLRRRLAVARDRQDFQGQIYGLNNLGTVLLQQGGNIQPAKDLFTEARKIAQSVNNLPGEGLSLSNLGLVAAGSGDYLEAIKRYEVALSLRQKIGDPPGEINTLNNLGDAYRAIKSYDDALAAYRGALRLAEDIRDRSSQFRSLEGLAASYTARGKYDSAIKTIDQRLTLAREAQNPHQELNTLRFYARFYRNIGNYSEARRWYQQAIALARVLRDDQAEAILANELSQVLYRRAAQ